MIIGDTTFYRLTTRSDAPFGPSLVRMSDFDSDVPCPAGAPFLNYLSLWRGTNGPGLEIAAGSIVMAAARRRGMSLGEFCRVYSSMAPRDVDAIKRREASA